MKEIILYLYTDASVFRADRCRVAYKLVFLKDGHEEGSKRDSFQTDATQQGAILEGMCTALERLKEGNRLDVTVVCGNSYILSTVDQNQHITWSQNEWKKKDGSPAKYQEQWKRIVELQKARTGSLRARPPVNEEQNIMNGLGAEQFTGYAKLA